MKYVLLYALWSSSFGHAPSSAEFDNKQGCDNARAALLALHNDDRDKGKVLRVSYALCLPKRVND